MDNLVFAQDRFAQQGAGVFVNRPVLGSLKFEGDRSFLYLGLVVFVLLAVLVRNLRESTTGTTLAAVRSSEIGVATVGLSVVRAKLVAFGVSAFIAGVGGGMMATYSLRARPDSFNTLTGVVWLAVVVTLGVRSSIGPFFAGLSFVIMPELITTWSLPHWALQLPPLLFGLGAVLLARDPRGVVVQTGERWLRQGRYIRGRFRRPETVPAAGGGA
jgi:branched-chain amino acid transport system permease protein